MQIHDAAGIASALHDLITHNRLAWQLACAWDAQHSNDMPIVLACEKIRDEWKKMVWLSRLTSLLDLAITAVLAFGLCGIVSGMYHFKNLEGSLLMLVSGLILLGLIAFLLIRCAKSARRQMNAYCQLGNQL